jgi:hypothetical protein
MTRLPSPGCPSSLNPASQPAFLLPLFGNPYTYIHTYIYIYKPLFGILVVSLSALHQPDSSGLPRRRGRRKFARRRRRRRRRRRQRAGGGVPLVHVARQLALPRRPGRRRRRSSSRSSSSSSSLSWSRSCKTAARAGNCLVSVWSRSWSRSGHGAGHGLVTELVTVLRDCCPGLPCSPARQSCGRSRRRRRRRRRHCPRQSLVLDSSESA